MGTRSVRDFFIVVLHLIIGPLIVLLALAAGFVPCLYHKAE